MPNLARHGSQMLLFCGCPPAPGVDLVSNTKLLQALDILIRNAQKLERYDDGHLPEQSGHQIHLTLPDKGIHLAAHKTASHLAQLLEIGSCKGIEQLAAADRKSVV